MALVILPAAQTQKFYPRLPRTCRNPKPAPPPNSPEVPGRLHDGSQVRRRQLWRWGAQCKAPKRWFGVVGLQGFRGVGVWGHCLEDRGRGGGGGGGGGGDFWVPGVLTVPPSYQDPVQTEHLKSLGGRLGKRRAVASSVPDVRGQSAAMTQHGIRNAPSWPSQHAFNLRSTLCGQTPIPSKLSVEEDEGRGRPLTVRCAWLRPSTKWPTVPMRVPFGSARREFTRFEC